MPTVAVPEGLEYVGAAFLANCFLQIYQITNVSKARKAAGIKYPQLYAEAAQAAASKEAFRFNCAQRAHQNTLEYLPMIAICTLVSATKWPIVAASGLGLWTFARLLYTIGYTSGDPAKRNTTGGAGFFGALGSFSLLAAATYAVVQSIFL